MASGLDSVNRMLRIAMLSFWHVHAKDYLRQASEHPGVEVVAIWDEDAARGRARADELGIDFVADLDALLARDDIDAVINDAPTSLHREVLTKAANAGKHIFTEKVVAATVEDHRAIEDAVRANNVVMTVSLPRLYEAYTPVIDQVLADGTLGQLTYVKVRLSHGGGVDNWLPEHFYDPELTGGGALIDLGCHPMYLTARFLGGLPQSVSATFGHVTGRAVEDSAVSVLSYPNGAIGVAEAGFVNRQNPFEIEIHGTDGSLFFGTPDAKLLVKGANDDGFVEVPIGDALPMAFDQWVDAVAAGTPIEDNLTHARNLTALMDASTRSAEQGLRIPLSEVTG